MIVPDGHPDAIPQCIRPDEIGRSVNPGTIAASGQHEENENPATDRVILPRSCILSNNEREIPLSLIPHIIAMEIRKMGDKIHRISVKRTHWHHYNVSVRTKLIAKELDPGRVTKHPHALDPFSGNRVASAGSGRADAA
jgi:hypothetical protein